MLSTVGALDLSKITGQGGRVRPGATVGPRDVVVTNPSGRTARSSNALRVLPGPTDTIPWAAVEDVDPAVLRTGERTEIDVYGSGFTDWSEACRSTPPSWSMR